MISVTRRYHFSASHRLHSSQLSAEENSRVFGKCNNPYGHGHDYVLEVTASGEADPMSGLLFSVAALDRLVDEEVLRAFAWRNINLDLPQFKNLTATTENIALVILGLLEQHWGKYLEGTAARLSRVYIQETERNSFEVFAGGETSVPDPRRMESAVHA